MSRSARGRGRETSGGRYIVVGLMALAVLVGGLVLARPWSWCPVDWSGASRIELIAKFADVTLDGRRYRIGGDALLDYGLRVLTTPVDQLLYRTQGERHPLTVIANISAESRDALDEPEFTCVRATLGSANWSQRPITFGTQTLADGYPPGAPPPQRNEAWRQAVAKDGPEWPAGESISLELWLSVRGQRYVVALPPFALLKGG